MKRRIRKSQRRKSQRRIRRVNNKSRRRRISGGEKLYDGQLSNLYTGSIFDPGFADFKTKMLVEWEWLETNDIRQNLATLYLRCKQKKIPVKDDVEGLPSYERLLEGVDLTKFGDDSNK